MFKLTKASRMRARAPKPARSIIMPTISERRVAFARLAIVVTVVSWTVYAAYWLWTEFVLQVAYSLRLQVEAVAYLFMVTILSISSLAYLACRLGFLNRARDHKRVPRAVIDEYFFHEGHPTLTVIVPSYREEPQVIRNTLLSAALQEFRGLRVVLLIDDSPTPKTAKERFLLEEARRIPAEIQDVLQEPLDHSRHYLNRLRSFGYHDSNELKEMENLVDEYNWAKNWLNSLADSYPRHDNADNFLAEEVFRVLAADFALTAEAIREAIIDGVSLPIERLIQLAERLTSVFKVKLTSFERKNFISLSHEANKAANLNSYIGLMGGDYQILESPRGSVLAKHTEGTIDIDIPNPDYVLTLDADSILLPEYCLRLVHLLEQPEYATVAVAQTPYSAFPNPATRLERIAGATTDIQYIVHQGLTQYGATFWVGANAVLRKTALDDLMAIEYVNGFEIRRYIQDRTAIEDTESSIDIGDHGWILHNYPERLSYSATPSDFGSLCIQRRRWADGGLIILPKLFHQARVRRRSGKGNRIGELVLRTNYMGSLTWTSVGLIVLLSYPFAPQLGIPLVGLIALPYFVGMANDLRYLGYKRRDILKVYGFNLILIPVNLAGSGSSIVQMFTGEKGKFGRTPKIKKRTVAPMLFVVMPYFVIALAAFTVYRDINYHRWFNLTFASLNLVLASYAVIRFIGIFNSLVDIWIQGRRYLNKPERVVNSRSEAPSELIARPTVSDWQAVLYFGASHVTHNLLPASSVRKSLSGVNRDSILVLTAAESVDSVLSGGFITLFQPVIDLRTGAAVGYEALSRFNDGRSVLQTLANAELTGERQKLEMALATSALRQAKRLPAGCWLGINSSLEFATGFKGLGEMAADLDRELVVEIPGSSLVNIEEDQPVAADHQTNWTISVNDAELNPQKRIDLHSDQIRYAKVGREWIRDIEQDPSRQELLQAMVKITKDEKCVLIAVGVETEAEVETLRGLGINLAQGFYLGVPKEAFPELLSGDKSQVSRDRDHP